MFKTMIRAIRKAITRESIMKLVGCGLIILAIAALSSVGDIETTWGETFFLIVLGALSAWVGGLLIYKADPSAWKSPQKL